MKVKCLKTMHLSQVGANLMTIVTAGQVVLKYFYLKETGYIIRYVLSFFSFSVFSDFPMI